MADLHSALDFFRDVLVAIVAGLLVPFILSWLAHRRATRKRIERLEVEIRHTQKEAGIEPFFDGTD